MSPELHACSEMHTRRSLYEGFQSDGVVELGASGWTFGARHGQSMALHWHLTHPVVSAEEGAPAVASCLAADH